VESSGDFGQIVFVVDGGVWGISSVKARLRSQACYNSYHLGMMAPSRRGLQIKITSTTGTQTPRNYACAG